VIWGKIFEQKPLIKNETQITMMIASFDQDEKPCDRSGKDE
jgi:hypothetical protein